MLYAFNTTKETERNKGTKQQNNRCIRDSRDSSITCNENLEKLLKLAESEEVQKFHDMLAFSEDVKAFHSILSCIAMKQENSPPELRK